MLIRLVGHFKNNPRSIDKMIAIKGLPSDWIFREGPNGRELVAPWRPDIDKNIPMDIRNLCEPEQITFRYPPIERGANWVIESRRVLGVVVDYMTEPGREMWEKIERFIEGTIPRNERVPQPVLLAKDPHSVFETYEPRRDSSNHLYLEPSAIPEIDLRPYVKQSPLQGPSPEAPELVLPAKAEASMKAEVPPASLFKCDQCDYTHPKKQGMRMHTLKRHPEKEKVGIS